MQTYKRSVVLQLGVFGFFFFYGLDNIIKSLVETNLIFSIIELSALVLILGVGLFFYYKTPKETLYVVKQTEINRIKLSLYAVSAALILSILVTGFQLNETASQYLNIVTGALISLSGLYGVYLGMEIVKNNK